MANNQNLIPYKKGESGNPAGLPKGYVRASVVYAKLLVGKMSIKQAGKTLKKTRREVMMIKAVLDALDEKNTASERTQARESVLSRIEGKPVQPLGAAPDTEVTLIIKGKEAKL